MRALPQLNSQVSILLKSPALSLMMLPDSFSIKDRPYLNTGGGREALYSAMKQLRQMGLLKKPYFQAGHRWILTEEGIKVRNLLIEIRHICNEAVNLAKFYKRQC